MAKIGSQRRNAASKKIIRLLILLDRYAGVGIKKGDREGRPYAIIYIAFPVIRQLPDQRCSRRNPSSYR